MTVRQRAIFDQYVAERRTQPIEGYELELLPFASRYVPLKKGTEGFLNFTTLPAGDERRLIREQVAWFELRDLPFEWKVYDFDSPSNLRQLLELEGFVSDPPEAFLVYSVDRALPSKAVDSPRIEIRQAAADDSTIDDFVKIQASVWQRDFSWLERDLRDTMRAHPDQLSVYCAYRDGVPVGAGKIHFAPNSRFADIRGGSVVEEARGQGIYSLLLQRRLEEAKARGYAYLAVDAAPMSRPILERAGFDPVCGTCPMKRSFRRD
jgi:GNAT superfamily N-acetyltransferase